MQDIPGIDLQMGMIIGIPEKSSARVIVILMTDDETSQENVEEDGIEGKILTEKGNQ